MKRTSPIFSRRGLIRSAAGVLGLAGPLSRSFWVPSARAATGGGSEPKFIFIFAQGGWDVTYALAPVFDNSAVQMPDGSSQAETDGIAWVSHPDRPEVDAYFNDYASRTCMVHGLEVRSIAHERCTRILLTGGTSANADDFLTRIGSASTGAPLPFVAFSGPCYAAENPESVVRIGLDGQFTSLADGSAVATSDPPLTLPSASSEALEEALVRKRVATAAAAAGRGRQTKILGAYKELLDRTDAVVELQSVLSDAGEDSESQALAAVSLMASGAARCAMIQELGFQSLGWDHHSDITRQGPSFASLFTTLNSLIAALIATPGMSGAPLIDEVTVVGCSELGRDPRLNSAGGKDHWTTTSLMMFGAGIRGGTTLGAYSSSMAATPIVLDTAELDADSKKGGVVLEPAHIGATLMQLAGLDPLEEVGAPPILGILEAGS